MHKLYVLLLAWLLPMSLNAQSQYQQADILTSGAYGYYAIDDLIW